MHLGSRWCWNLSQLSLGESGVHASLSQGRHWKTNNHRTILKAGSWEEAESIFTLKRPSSKRNIQFVCLICRSVCDLVHLCISFRVPLVAKWHRGHVAVSGWVWLRWAHYQRLEFRFYEVRIRAPHFFIPPLFFFFSHLWNCFFFFYFWIFKARFLNINLSHLFQTLYNHNLWSKQEKAFSFSTCGTCC